MEGVLEQPEELMPVTFNGPVNNSTIFDLLMNEEDLTWQTLLYELVKTNQMDPWDIDIKILSKQFIHMIKEIKEKLDFRISGKIVLAAAILLKMKSNKLLLEDISAFDNLISGHNELEEDFMDSEQGDYEDYNSIMENKPKIFPRTPQPRTRKVSIFDLVEALEKALDTKNKRVQIQRVAAPKVEAPKNHKDISLVIGETYEMLKEISKELNTNKLVFHEILASDCKEDKVYTFIPLLHLTNQRKTDLEQDVSFGDIHIHLLENI